MYKSTVSKIGKASSAKKTTESFLQNLGFVPKKKSMGKKIVHFKEQQKK